MKTKEIPNALDSISTIYEKTEGCKFNKEIFSTLDGELTNLSVYFKTTKTQAFFLSIVFSLNYKNTNTIDFSDISKHMDSNPMTLLKYTKDFDLLCDKGYLIKEKTNYNFEVAYADSLYTVEKHVTKAVLNNVPIVENGNKHKSIINVLEEISLLCEQRDDDRIRTRVLFRKVEKIIKQNIHFKFIKQIDRYKFLPDQRLLYMYLIWETLVGNETTDIESAIEKIIEGKTYRIELLQNFNNPIVNKLLKLELVEIEASDFINNSRMRLTKKSLLMLEDEGIKLFSDTKKKKKEGVIEPKNIIKTKLFYNKTEEKQISMIENALRTKKYNDLQKRLKEKSLPTGITALFYGFPGTGKTESVLQIAKQTGRDIMKVDISQTKSKWFGDSEKIVKQIFTNYYEYKKQCKKTPILLFNEADAVISKRKEASSSNVAQTENAIQNIILEELESFDGIFIATTNLAKNLDTAFERRFLFKVEFFKPKNDVKAKIWKSKLKSLKLNECKLLAEQYNFTGGQINNIIRKCEMSEILEAEKINFNKIQMFCDEETIVKQNYNKIGFNI